MDDARIVVGNIRASQPEFRMFTVPNDSVPEECLRYVPLDAMPTKRQVPLRASLESVCVPCLPASERTKQATM
jgi:hypothetical protein